MYKNKQQFVMKLAELIKGKGAIDAAQIAWAVSQDGVGELELWRNGEYVAPVHNFIQWCIINVGQGGILDSAYDSIVEAIKSNGRFVYQYHGINVLQYAGNCKPPDNLEQTAQTKKEQSHRKSQLIEKTLEFNRQTCDFIDGRWVRR